MILSILEDKCVEVGAGSGRGPEWYRWLILLKKESSSSSSSSSSDRSSGSSSRSRSSGSSGIVSSIGSKSIEHSMGSIDFSTDIIEFSMISIFFLMR